MQLHLEGSAPINATREAIFSMLTDTTFLARSLPDSEDVRVLDAANLEARVKVKVAVVSSSLKLKMTVAEKDPPVRAKLVAEGSGGGSKVKLTSVFTLEGEGPTKVNWSADAEVSGVMSGLGSGILKGFASKKVGEIFEGISKSIEASST